MNGAYQHLLINHIPVVGFPICFLILLTGAFKKSRDLIQVGLLGVVLLAAISFLSKNTGGPAAHVLHDTPGINIVWPQVREHAEAAEKATTVAIIVGVLALVGWGLSCRTGGAPMALVILVLLGTLMVSVAMGRVAHLGGLIRHPEIQAAPAAPAQ